MDKAFNNTLLLTTAVTDLIYWSAITIFFISIAIHVYKKGVDTEYNSGNLAFVCFTGVVSIFTLNITLEKVATVLAYIFS